MKSRLFPVLTAAVAVLVAFTIGFLVALWRGGQTVDPEQTLELDQRNELNLLEMQEGLTDRVADTMTNEQQERMQSPLGLAMFRKCVEWTDFNENHPSETSTMNEQQACAEFRQYVETGEIPE